MEKEGPNRHRLDDDRDGVDSDDAYSCSESSDCLSDVVVDDDDAEEEEKWG